MFYSPAEVLLIVPMFQAFLWDMYRVWTIQQVRSHRLRQFATTPTFQPCVVAVVVSGSTANPGDALVPVKPRVTPIPTVTVFVTPSPSPTK